MLDEQLFKQDLFLNICQYQRFKIFTLNRYSHQHGRLAAGRSAKEGTKLSRKFVWRTVGQAHPAEEFAFPIKNRDVTVCLLFFCLLPLAFLLIASCFFA